MNLRIGHKTWGINMQNSGLKTRLLIVGLTAIFWLAASTAFGGPREQAFNMFNRLNGVPPTSEVWDAMENLIKEGKLKEAALIAIDDNRGNFYNTFLKDLIKPWTNEEEDVRVPFNDYVATVIGAVRDELPFNQLLYEDIVYVGISPDPATPLADYSIMRTTPDNVDGNQHYISMEERNLPLHKILVKRKQSDLSYLTDDVTSGLLTTRAHANAFWNAGTNRVASRFAFKNYLCHDIDQLLDTTRPDFRVRQDVSRQPGGDSSVYKNKCSGCHSGMDALTGAMAYYDWDDESRGLVYDPSAVREKFLRNSNEFETGFETKDDTWINLWAEGGPNTSLGWNGARKGRGLKSFGKMLGQTDAFASCMATKALDAVCDVNLDDPNVKNAIKIMANNFKAKGKYNMKHLFAQAAIMCKGE